MALVIAAAAAISLAGCASAEPSVQTTAAASSDAEVSTPSESVSSAENDSVFPFTLVTQDEEEVTFTHVPERILSTNPNTGEQLMALGLGDKIIATCYNNAKLPQQWAAEYESKPVIAEKYPSLETVLDLNPDFIYGRSSAFGDRDRNHVPGIHRRL